MGNVINKKIIGLGQTRNHIIQNNSMMADKYCKMFRNKGIPNHQKCNKKVVS